MFIIYMLAILLGYAFIGGILARITWPIQKRIDRRAKAKDPKVEVSHWKDHLFFCFLLWPAVIIAYFFYIIGLILTTLFSIGIEDKGE